MLKTTLRTLHTGSEHNPFHHRESMPITIAADDFHADGVPDIVIASSFNNVDSNELDLFPGKGDGTFGEALVASLNARPQDMAVADVNGDGIPDVALITRSQQIVPEERSLRWLFLGTKDGPIRLARNWPLPEEPARVFLADFDADGKVDIGISSDSASSWIYPGRGDGTFSEPVLACRCKVSLVADMDGDRRPDLITGGTPKGGHTWGSIADPFSFPNAVPLDAPQSTVVAEADLNGDGRPDLVFAAQNGISVYLANSDGAFRHAGRLAVEGEAHVLRVRDLNRDGRISPSQPGVAPGGSWLSFPARETEASSRPIDESRLYPILDRDRRFQSRWQTGFGREFHGRIGSRGLSTKAPGALNFANGRLGG